MGRVGAFSQAYLDAERSIQSAHNSMFFIILIVQVRERAWFVRLCGEIILSFSEGIIDCTGAQTMLYLTCTVISGVDLAHYEVAHAKDWVSVDCGTIILKATKTKLLNFLTA